jgi:hypothetical protein
MADAINEFFVKLVDQWHQLAVLPISIGRLELFDIPGRWGRVDAFGRGRVDTQRGAGAV